MKTVQSWEDVVGDLGQVLKLRGDLKLFTINGQEVMMKFNFVNKTLTVYTILRLKVFLNLKMIMRL